MKMINAVYTTALLVASVTTTYAADLQNIKIAAGGEKGEYTKTIVPAISEALKEYGYSATPEISEGSQNNIDQVVAGTLPAGLSQFDAAAFNMTPDKDPDKKLVLMGKLAPEALFCAAKKGGNIKTYADLTGDRQTPLKISAGVEKSGTAHTVDYLITLDPNLKKNVERSYQADTAMEINRLLTGHLDLVCFMMMPNPENELIQMVANNEELFFMEIDNPVFAKAKVGNLNVYEIMEVPVSKGVLGVGTKKVKTLVTWIGIMVNTAKIDSKLSNALNQVVQKKDLLPTSSLAVSAQKLLDDFAKIIGK